MATTTQPSTDKAGEVLKTVTLMRARNTACTASQTATPTALPASHNTHTHGVAFYEHTTIHTPRRITIFGDVEPRRGYFTDCEKGALVNFGMDFLLHAQPERKSLIVFLTDSSAFQFYEIERLATGEFQTTESEILKGVETGWRVSAPANDVVFYTYMLKSLLMQTLHRHCSA